MKTHLFTLVAACAALTGCGVPSAGALIPATFGQDAADLPGFAVKAGQQAATDETAAPKAKPFFKQQQLLAIMQGATATADVLDGAQPLDAATEVSFDVRGVEKLESDQIIAVSGKLTFRDTTRGLRFQGDVTGRNVYLSDQILWSHLTGTLDDGSPFALSMGEISIYAVHFTFQVFDPDGTTVRYQYTGEGAKGKLKTMRN